MSKNSPSFPSGFTLIELLVVIAILGILAAVVMVSINPGQRTAEANDVTNKSEVGQVARALENWFTNHVGSYSGATSGAGGTLVTQGYLKRWPASTTINVTATVSSVSAPLAAASAACGRGSGSYKYWCYSSSDGLTVVLCTVSAVTPNTSCTG